MEAALYTKAAPSSAPPSIFITVIVGGVVAQWSGRAILDFHRHIAHEGGLLEAWTRGQTRTLPHALRELRGELADLSLLHLLFILVVLRLIAVGYAGGAGVVGELGAVYRHPVAHVFDVQQRHVRLVSGLFVFQELWALELGVGHHGEGGGLVLLVLEYIQVHGRGFGRIPAHTLVLPYKVRLGHAVGVHVEVEEVGHCGVALREVGGLGAPSELGQHILIQHTHVEGVGHSALLLQHAHVHILAHHALLEYSLLLGLELLVVLVEDVSVAALEGLQLHLIQGADERVPEDLLQGPKPLRLLPLLAV